jgi:hypothetical protein
MIGLKYTLEERRTIQMKMNKKNILLVALMVCAVAILFVDTVPKLIPFFRQKMIFAKAVTTRKHFRIRHFCDDVRARQKSPIRGQLN